MWLGVSAFCTFWTEWWKRWRLSPKLFPESRTGLSHSKGSPSLSTGRWLCQSGLDKLYTEKSARNNFNCLWYVLIEHWNKKLSKLTYLEKCHQHHSIDKGCSVVPLRKNGSNNLPSAGSLVGFCQRLLDILKCRLTIPQHFQDLFCFSFTAIDHQEHWGVWHEPYRNKEDDVHQCNYKWKSRKLFSHCNGFTKMWAIHVTCVSHSFKRGVE